MVSVWSAGWRGIATHGLRGVLAGVPLGLIAALLAGTCPLSL